MSQTTNSLYPWSRPPSPAAACPTADGCPAGVCPDLTIRRHDTLPEFSASVYPLDLTDVAVEASMWVKARTAKAVLADDTQLALAGNLGFNQMAPGDMIVVDRPRDAEQMLILGFDEVARLVAVERGYNNTVQLPYPKGTGLRSFRVLNAVGSTQMTRMDVIRVDGSTDPQVLTESKVLYGWATEDTSLPGCFHLELKLVWLDAAGDVLSYQRYPADGREGYLIRVVDSPTGEDVVVVRGRHFRGSGGSMLSGSYQ